MIVSNEEIIKMCLKNQLYYKSQLRRDTESNLIEDIFIFSIKVIFFWVILLFD